MITKAYVAIVTKSLNAYSTQGCVDLASHICLLAALNEFIKRADITFCKYARR